MNPQEYWPLPQKWTFLALPSLPQICILLTLLSPTLVILVWHFIFLFSQYHVGAGSITPHATTAFQGISAGKEELWQLGFWYLRIRVPKNFGTQGLGSLGFSSSMVAAWLAIHCCLFSPETVSTCWVSGLVFAPSWLLRGAEAMLSSAGDGPQQLLHPQLWVCHHRAETKKLPLLFSLCFLLVVPALS